MVSLMAATVWCIATLLCQCSFALEVEVDASGVYQGNSGAIQGVQHSPIGKHEMTAAMRKRVSWSKRQPAPQVVSRMLSVTFEFHCPEGGRMERLFEWAALYKPAERHVLLVGMHNIDYMDPPYIEHHDFYTHWHHKFCEHYGLRLCYYKVDARTEGTVSPHGVTLSIITNSNILGEDTTVQEVCISADRPPPNETCWKSHISIAYGPCAITAITVNVPH